MKLVYEGQTDTEANRFIIMHLDEIAKMYEEGMNLKAIGIKLGIKSHALEKLMKLNNVKARGVHSYNRKFFPKEDYFDIINTEEKAYFMGFLYADGNNYYKRNCVSIQLSTIDKEILQKFSHIIYNVDMIRDYKRKDKKTGKILESSVLNIFNEHISKHLITLGLVERKSDKIEFPLWLDKYLYKHFIRGIIDGDGCISLPVSNRESPKIILISTKKMNDSIATILKNELDINSYICVACNQDINIINNLAIKNYHQCKVLLDWLYKDSTIYLKRKYHIYQKFLGMYSNLREQNK